MLSSHYTLICNVSNVLWQITVEREEKRICYNIVLPYHGKSAEISTSYINSKEIYALMFSYAFSLSKICLWNPISTHNLKITGSSYWVEWNILSYTRCFDAVKVKTFTNRLYPHQEIISFFQTNMFTSQTPRITWYLS